MIGQTLGHFRITAHLGSGGMGVVYRAFDERLQRTVAIKVIGRESGAAAADRSRMVEEARAASGLNHPHICTVYETGEIDGQPFIAMEYVDGRPLSELIPADGLPMAAVVRYGVQIADALAHAHARGVVHRDLKTANVVVTGDGRAKVLDFGLARRIPTDIATTATRSSDAAAAVGLIGTLAYLAPEVLLGDPADERSDIWALGVMLFEMATGDVPFKGRNEFGLTPRFFGRRRSRSRRMSPRCFAPSSSDASRRRPPNATSSPARPAPHWKPSNPTSWHSRHSRHRSGRRVRIAATGWRGRGSSASQACCRPCGCGQAVSTAPRGKRSRVPAG